jgi:hypothetical protein
MSKGLAHSDLIRLKRVGAAGKGGASGAKREAFISRMARAPLPPPVVLIGHAASLTPY